MIRSEKLLTVAIGLVVLLIIGGFFYGISYLASGVEEGQDKIENVVRVFMHEPGNYSFLVEDKKSEKLVLMSYYTYNQEEVDLVTDVPANQKMWATVSWEKRGDGSIFFKEIVIHLHSANDVEGGAWNHGKHGRGTTHVLE